MKLSYLAIVTLFFAATLFSQRAEAQCQAGFDTTMSGLTVQFTNQASGSYNWIGYDYGDGNYSENVASPSYTFTPGIYEVCQYIQDTINWQCFDFECDTFYMGGATCMADFYYSADGLEVEFFSYPIGQFDSLAWDFGDGNTSSDSMPTHTYANTGTYTVCLSLFDDTTLCDSTCYTVFVDTNDCEADFSYSANNLNVSFTNQSSGSFNAVYWDFGDGFGFSEVNNPTYTYAIAGTYTVCVYVYDTVSGVCWDDYCEEITVTSGGGGGGCEADFEYETEQLELVCTNTSTGTYITALWSYGDGSNITTENVHEYEEPGTYEVCLTIGNLVPFCADVYCEEVTVTEFNCEPDFTYSFNDQNVYQFVNTTTIGNVTSVEWEFGDGNSSTFNNPSYTYNAPGIYTVCLITFDEDNMCGETCKDVEVYTLGVGTPDDLHAMNVFPNPTDGLLNIGFSGDVHGSVTLDIIDLQGRTVQSQRQQVDGSTMNVMLDVPAGAYYVKVSLENGGYFLKSVLVQQ